MDFCITGGAVALPAPSPSLTPMTHGQGNKRYFNKEKHLNQLPQ